MSLFTPDYFEDSIFNININKLKGMGIKLILTDIDNTIVPYGVLSPTKKILSWFETLKSNGIEICFLSNNDFDRVDKFNKELGCFAIHKANKPLPFSYKACIKHFGVSDNETIFIGDQLFTDVLGAKLSNIKCILVKPIKTDNEEFQIRFKRKLEKFFLNRMLPKKLGVIGNPIKHSLSPLMHKNFYKLLHINADYRRYQPKNDELEKYIDFFKSNNFLGFNVTVPYKSEIIKYLDYVDDNAKKINSVNTVKIVNGKLYGYSTDGDGFCMQLGNSLSEQKIKIIGAGGTTPSIVHSLVSKGAKEIIIYNRTFCKASVIAENYSNVFAMPLTDFTADDCDVLINTTSCELLTGKPPIDTLIGISEQTVVFDVNYKPKVTKFMQMAINNGCVAYNGLRMLLYQGLLAHKIWFNRKEEHL